jgi:hypothetical protein
MNINFGSNYEALPFDSKGAENWAFNEFRSEIKHLGVDYNIHALGLPDAFENGGWCLHSEDEVWLVYHAERGRRSGMSIFTSPFDAVNFLLWKLVARPSGSNQSVGLLPRNGVKP